MSMTGSGSPKVHFKDWPWVDVLIQRCLWGRGMSCPVPLHGAYITERRGHGPRRNQQMESHYLDDQAPLI